MKKLLTFATLSLLSTLTLGCGGGGGGSDSGLGDVYLAEASVTADTCDERLSNVRQTFSLGNDQILDTSLVSFPLADANGTLTGSFSEQNGECVRSYEAVLSNVGEVNAPVTLRSTSTCGTVKCATEWQGTLNAIAEDTAASSTRVRGENCNPNVPPEVGYRPSLFECNGNAAVLLRGALRNNYSVVVRRNGQFNDRDPRNPSCGTNRCSPYKTQKRIELPAYQVNCLGGSGFSDDYAPVNRISIKFDAKIEDANDESQFEQYCLTDVRVGVN